MVLTISTNTPALAVQKNLNKASEAVASSLAKLSSGSRVPTAKDDAASLAIGSRVAAEVAGLKQASTNASQATSLLQIADGALGEINDVLVRQSSLAIQSSSGQLSDSERAIINSEFTKLTSEVDRIAQDTEFNGNKLLAGGTLKGESKEVAAGYLASKGLEVSLNAAEVEKNSLFEVTYNKDSEELTLTNKTTGEVTKQDITAALDKQAGTPGGSLKAGQELDVSFKDAGVTISLTNTFDRGTAIAAGAKATNTQATANIGDAGSFKVADLSAYSADAAVTGSALLLTTDGTDIAAAAGSTLQISVDGGAATALADGVAFTAGKTYSITDADGNQVAEINTEATNFAATAGTITLDSSTAVTSFGANTYSSAESTYDFKIGTGTEASDSIEVNVAAATASSLNLSGATVDTKDNANAAITTVKSAIDTLLNARANVGATLSRLDFASSNIAVAIENQTAAQSGLLDVDLATETTNFAAKQVVVQAGVSLLAQANQQPSKLLKLIG